MLLADTPTGRSEILALKGHHLLPVGQVPALWARTYGSQLVSPDGRYVAATRAVRHGGGYVASSAVAIEKLDGGSRRTFVAGQVIGWDHRDDVVVARHGGGVASFNAETGRRRTLLDVRAADRRLRASGIEPTQAAWSADDKYMAVRVTPTYVSGPRYRRGSTILIVSTATPWAIRVLSSPYDISLFSWAPRGAQFAYTTSGFPAPHQLLVASAPGRRPRRIFQTGARHFDWFTWSPDGRKILLDDQLADVWRLFSLSGSRPLTLPRFGGKMIWCCSASADLSIAAAQ